MTIFNDCFLWQLLRHWLQYWQLRTWFQDNLCYLTINCDPWQHSQFLQCFVCHPFSNVRGMGFQDGCRCGPTCTSEQPYVSLFPAPAPENAISHSLDISLVYFQPLDLEVPLFQLNLFLVFIPNLLQLDSWPWAVEGLAHGIGDHHPQFYLSVLKSRGLRLVPLTVATASARADNVTSPTRLDRNRNPWTLR